MMEREQKRKAEKESIIIIIIICFQISCSFQIFPSTNPPFHFPVLPELSCGGNFLGRWCKCGLDFLFVGFMKKFLFALRPRVERRVVACNHRRDMKGGREEAKGREDEPEETSDSRGVRWWSSYSIPLTHPLPIFSLLSSLDISLTGKES